MIVHTAASRYTVSVLPADHDAARHFTITVEHRGRDRWAVCHLGRCLSAGGGWSDEPRPSDATDEWLDGHRFDLDTALRLAEQAAPGLVCNGRTAAEVAG